MLFPHLQSHQGQVESLTESLTSSCLIASLPSHPGKSSAFQGPRDQIGPWKILENSRARVISAKSLLPREVHKYGLQLEHGCLPGRYSAHHILYVLWGAQCGLPLRRWFGCLRSSSVRTLLPLPVEAARVSGVPVSGWQRAQRWTQALAPWKWGFRRSDEGWWSRGQRGARKRGGRKAGLPVGQMEPGPTGTPGGPCVVPPPRGGAEHASPVTIPARGGSREGCSPCRRAPAPCQGRAVSSRREAWAGGLGRESAFASGSQEMPPLPPLWGPPFWQQRPRKQENIPGTPMSL